MKDLHQAIVVQGQVDLGGIVGQNVGDSPLQFTRDSGVEIEAERDFIGRRSGRKLSVSEKKQSQRTSEVKLYTGVCLRIRTFLGVKQKVQAFDISYLLIV